MDAAMAREAQTEAFDNFETSPYTETSAMQNGDEEVGTRGGYGRRLPNGLAFSEEARRAEGGAQEDPPSQEELDKVQAFWNKLMEEQEQERLRRKRSGK